jgi:hypothetical protein
MFQHMTARTLVRIRHEVCERLAARVADQFERQYVSGERERRFGLLRVPHIRNRHPTGGRVDQQPRFEQADLRKIERRFLRLREDLADCDAAVCVRARTRIVESFRDHGADRELECILTVADARARRQHDGA